MVTSLPVPTPLSCRHSATRKKCLLTDSSRDGVHATVSRARSGHSWRNPSLESPKAWAGYKELDIIFLVCSLLYQEDGCLQSGNIGCFQAWLALLGDPFTEPC